MPQPEEEQTPAQQCSCKELCTACGQQSNHVDRAAWRRRCAFSFEWHTHAMYSKAAAKPAYLSGLVLGCCVRA